MKRKLISQGSGGITLYVPKAWVQKCKLSAGEEVVVEERHNCLVVQAPLSRKREATLNLDDESVSTISIKLTHAYRVGIDRIIVHFSEPVTLKKISEVVKSCLLGFEVTRKEKSSCWVENITEPAEEKFSVVLRRIFLQIRETSNAMHADVSAQATANKGEIAAIKEETDKHVLFCRRLIAKRAAMEENSILHWELLTFLMHIQHAVYYLYGAYAVAPSLHQKTLSLFYRFDAYFENYYKAYYGRQEAYLDTLEKERLEFQEAILAELDNQKNKDKIFLSHLRELVRLVQIGGSPIRAILADAVQEQQGHQA